MFLGILKCFAVLLTASALIFAVSMKAVQYYYGQSYPTGTVVVGQQPSGQPNSLQGVDFMQQHELLTNDEAMTTMTAALKCNVSADCRALNLASCLKGYCECLPGFVKEVQPDSTQMKCQCPKGTTKYGNFCWRIAGFLGGQCEDDSTCTAQGSFCIEGTCKCHPKLKAWGGRCWDALELDSAAQREHLTLLMCFVIAAGLILPLIVKSCSRARRDMDNSFASGIMGARPLPRGRNQSGDLDAERVMAEFAASGDGASVELDANGMPTRFVPENDHPPAYADVVALCKYLESETILRQLQFQLEQHHFKLELEGKRAIRENGDPMASVLEEPSTSAAGTAPVSPSNYGACASIGSMIADDILVSSVRYVDEEDSVAYVTSNCVVDDDDDAEDPRGQPTSYSADVQPTSSVRRTPRHHRHHRHQQQQQTRVQSLISEDHGAALMAAARSASPSSTSSATFALLLGGGGGGGSEAASLHRPDSACDSLPSFTEAMASRRNSTAIFIGHDDFKEYLPPPEYASDPSSSPGSPVPEPEDD